MFGWHQLSRNQLIVVEQMIQESISITYLSSKSYLFICLIIIHYAWSNSDSILSFLVNISPIAFYMVALDAYNHCLINPNPYNIPNSRLKMVCFDWRWLLQYHVKHNYFIKFFVVFFLKWDECIIIYWWKPYIIWFKLLYKRPCRVTTGKFSVAMRNRQFFFRTFFCFRASTRLHQWNVNGTF